MGVFDWFSLVVENLGRRKARVAMTAIGVIIGTSSVVILVSLAIGLQRNAQARLFGIGDLTQIQVSPGFEEPSGPIAFESVGPGQPSGYLPITDQTIADLEAIPGVIQVVPQDGPYGGVLMKYNRLEAWAGITAVGVDDLSLLGLAAQQGELKLDRATAVIGSQIPLWFADPQYRPGQEPPPPPELLGQTIKVTLIKYDEQEQQEIRKTVQFRVGGILAEKHADPDWTIYMTMDVVKPWNEWFIGRRINRDKDGYGMALVRVSDARETVDVAEQINNMGYRAHTGQSVVEELNSFYLVLQIIFGGVGAIALLVAAIGIANTMAMAILERTREIGLMKAIGATNRDVVSIFLGEAAGIGFIGGIGGALVGWSMGQVINVLALVYMAEQLAQQGWVSTSIAVYTPPWLLGFALAFATLIGLLSGLYPAMRAATLVPVVALKYE